MWINMKNKMKVVVIMPTYNERDNIAPMIGALQSEFGCIPHDMHILVVDDNSPDGTSNMVSELVQKYTNLHLITGEKRGLGAAYIRGMTFAMDMLKADAVFEMDADFSHDPADVPRLLKALEGSADFVIGSRYVEGGSIPNDWSLLRKANSVLGNFVARNLAGMYRIRDCTAGFRLISVSILKQINFSALRVQGYAFQVALLHQAITLGAVVKEIPVHFIDRKYGQSKLDVSDIVEFIINAWWIRLRSSETFIKFSLVGLSGVLVNLGIFTLLLNFGTNMYVASPIAIEFSVISNFLLNNYWTFARRKTKDRVRIKGIKFNIVSVFSLAVSYSTFVVLTLLFPAILPQVHQFISIAPAMLINYFLNSYWTFRPHNEASRN